MSRHVRQALVWRAYDIFESLEAYRASHVNPLVRKVEPGAYMRLCNHDLNAEAVAGEGMRLPYQPSQRREGASLGDDDEITW